METAGNTVNEIVPRTADIHRLGAGFEMASELGGRCSVMSRACFRASFRL